MPSPSQITWRAPRNSASTRSIASRVRPAPRFGFSRHDSVVSTVPTPSPSMPPPSSTTSQREARQAEDLLDVTRNGVVEFPAGILAAPVVEAEVADRACAIRASPRRSGRDRAPGVVRRGSGGNARRDRDRRRRRGSPARDLFHRVVRDADLDGFVRRERAHDRGEGRAHGRQRAGPGLEVVRPREPGRAVALPLGGPAVAERCGRRAAQLNPGSASAGRRRRRCGGRAGRASRGACFDQREVALDDQRLFFASPRPARSRGRTDRRRTTVPRSVSRSSAPTRFTATTKTPFAIACARCTVSQASCSASFPLGALVDLPADRRRVEEHLRAGERGEPRRFGEPLVPAHQRADARRRGSETPGSRGRRA